jgi:hypothetical protein
MDVFSTELGIRLSFVKTLKFRHWHTLFYLATVGSPVNQKIKTIGRALWKVLADLNVLNSNWNVTHHLPVRSDCVYRLGGNINTTCITKNTKLYLVASKKVGLYVSDKKATKLMAISRQGNVHKITTQRKITNPLKT